MTFFTIINKQNKELNKDSTYHYQQVEKILRPLANNYNLGAATRITQKYFKDHNEYPVLSFAHEDGIVHIMFDDGVGSGEEAFLESMLNMLIDKGEFIDKTNTTMIKQYHKLLDDLKALKFDMKKYLKESYKKNRGKDKLRW